MPKKITADQLKAAVLCYWRYKKQYPLLSLETHYRLEPYPGELADILAVSRERFLVETEVKTTLADFRKDRSKQKHAFLRMGTPFLTSRFYFAVPQEIANKVAYECAQLYPYAGVLGVYPAEWDLHGWKIELHKRPKVLKGPRLTFSQVINMTRAQTATLCRMQLQIAKLRNNASE